MIPARFAANDLPTVARLNRLLEKSWRAGWSTKPTLDPAALVAKAEKRERARLRPGDWRTALELLTGDLERNAALNPLGRTMAHGQLVRILRQRARAERLWGRHPDILERPISQPVVILGHMRSGTTRLHRLLACDRQFAFTRFRENLDTLSATRVRSWLSAVLVRALLEICNPALRAIHPTTPSAAEEEFGLHAFSLHGAMFEAQWHIPEFARWNEDRVLGPIYAEFRSLLQTLAWRRGDPVDAIQLLKAPQFMDDLPALLAEFPDSRLLLLTRDPAAVLASSASLVWNQRRVQSDRADRAAVGPEWQAKTARRQQRADAALASLPKDRILPITFENMNCDWHFEVRRIYDFLGLPLSSETGQKMARVMNSRDHRQHRYRPDDFGLRAPMSAV